MTGRGAQGQHPRVSTARKAQLGTGRRQRPGRGGGAVLLLAVAVLTAQCGRGGVPESTAPRASCRRAPDGQSGAHLARLRLHWPPCPDGRQLVLPGALRCLALRGGGARALRSAKGPAAQTPVAADRARGAPRRSALAPGGCVSPFSAALRRAKAGGAAAGADREKVAVQQREDEEAAGNTTLWRLQQQARLSVLGADAYIPVRVRAPGRAALAVVSAAVLQSTLYE